MISLIFLYYFLLALKVKKKHGYNLVCRAGRSNQDRESSGWMEIILKIILLFKLAIYHPKHPISSDS